MLQFSVLLAASQASFAVVGPVVAERLLGGPTDWGWIAGAYVIQTNRYIYTGNQVDRGFGVFDVKKTPRASVFVDPTDLSPQLGLLADDTGPEGTGYVVETDETNNAATRPIPRPVSRPAHSGCR